MNTNVCFSIRLDHSALSKCVEKLKNQI